MKTTIAYVTWLLCFTGCAGSYVPMYASVSGACIAQERSIVDRDGSSEEDDRRDLASLRSVCDDLLARIEEEATK